MRAFLDISAAGKLVQAEAESEAMEQFANRSDVELVGSMLLETELRRMAVRNGFDQADVSDVLDGITLYPFRDSDFMMAGILPGEMLRSLDALHIQCALSVGVDCVVTYDTRMIDACSQVGLVTVQPGANTGANDESVAPALRRQQDEVLADVRASVKDMPPVDYDQLVADINADRR